MASVEDFISAEKGKLQLEKEALMLSIKKFLKNYEDRPLKELLHPQDEGALCQQNNANHNYMTTLNNEDFGLPLGGYEKKHKQLAEERRREYNRFLEEKNEKAVRRQCPSSQSNSPDGGSQSPFDYKQLLQKKKEEEKQYRDINGLSTVDGLDIAKMQKELEQLRAEREEFMKLKFSGVFGNNEMPMQQQNTESSDKRFNLEAISPNMGSSTENETLIPSPQVNYRRPMNVFPSESDSFRQKKQQKQADYRQALEKQIEERKARKKTVANETQHKDFSFSGLKFPSAGDLRNAGSMFGVSDNRQKISSDATYQGDLEAQIKEKQKIKAMECDENKKPLLPSHQVWNYGGRSGGRGPLITEADVSRKRNYMAANATNFDVNHPFAMPNNNLPTPNIIKLNSTVIRDPSSYTNQDKYKEDLLQQIEEKKQRIQEEKERQRKEEEKLALRIEEQRLRIQREYEEEQEKRRIKEEELRRKQERLIQIREQQKKEMERKNKALMEHKEEKNLLPTESNQEKTNSISSPTQQRNESPPIPSLRTKTLENLSLPSCPSATSEDSTKDILSNLSQLRQQLLIEQRKLNERLKSKVGNQNSIVPELQKKNSTPSAFQ